MAGLSDKLKSLGVKIGAQDIPKPSIAPKQDPAEILPGWPLVTPYGETYLVEKYYSPGELDSLYPGRTSSPLSTIASFTGENSAAAIPLESLAFLDTETTGLSGGTGTFAFMIGVGRFESDSFHLAQFFMRDPSEEIAQLYALEQFLAPCQALVTFNGKAFDVPLLNTRFTINGWPTPMPGLKQIDLLHLARKLWRYRLPSRTLGNLEVQILGTSRTEEDIPGWMIPQIYLEYLHSGDPSLVKNIFYHNAMDILSLTSLFNHISDLLTNPLDSSTQHAADLIALARVYEDQGELDLAVNLYQRTIMVDTDGYPPSSTHVQPREIRLEACQRLAMIYKRQNDYRNAVSFWERAAGDHHLDAMIELAKYYEHVQRDYDKAMEWTQSAADLLHQSQSTDLDRLQWLPEIEHRMKRLTQKYEQHASNAT